MHQRVAPNLSTSKCAAVAKSHNPSQFRCGIIIAQPRRANHALRRREVARLFMGSLYKMLRYCALLVLLLAVICITTVVSATPGVHEESINLEAESLQQDEISIEEEEEVKPTHTPKQQRESIFADGTGQQKVFKEDGDDFTFDDLYNLMMDFGDYEDYSPEGDKYAEL